MTSAAGRQTPDCLASADFTPAWWLPGAHLQTLWPFLFHRQSSPTPMWERLELPDGDFLDLAWFAADAGGHAARRPDSPSDSQNICLLLHGLEGCYRSHYIPGLVRSLNRAGWRVVVMHFRGCSGVHNRLPRSYHSGDTGDIGYVINLLRQREQPLSLTAAGFSLGGNVLLKYLGERGDDTGLDGACAVSVPFDLAAGAARLDRGLSRLYQWWLVRSLRHKLRDKFAQGDCPIDLAILDRHHSFRQFDGNVTAPLHGFADADDYYQRSSSKPFLRQITLPTLILQAADDPFLEPHGLPSAAELGPAVQLELSAHGGHVGFVGGRVPGRASYWLERRIPAFLGHFQAPHGSGPR